MGTRYQLHTGSTTPLYRQLYAQIRAAIQRGELAVGERLPPTREFAASLKVNRTTVATAYELLEAEGWLKGHVGRGSFVANPEPPSQPSQSEEATQPSQPISHPISFATSRPSARLFPLDEFRATLQEVAEGPELTTILQLGSPSGYGPLRQYLRDLAVTAHEARDADDVVVVNGCQQALDLTARVLAPAGETVLVEDPVYPGLRNVFQRAGARLVGVPLGSEGIDLEALQRLVVRERPRVLAVTPNFQNPTGLTMPLEARRDLLQIAHEGNVVVIENDLYGDLRYAGEPLPTLKQLDESSEVILLRSFSKITFPGLRVGWILAGRALAAKLAEAKQWSDLHSDQLSQAVLLRFAEAGRLRRHLTTMLSANRERLRAALTACQAHLPQGAVWTRPEGGMNLWVRLPDPLDAAAILPAAERRGVSYLPGRAFAVSRETPGGLRLSFAGLTPAEIEAGIAVLGELFQEEEKRAKAGRFEPAAAMV